MKSHYLPILLLTATCALAISNNASAEELTWSQCIEEVTSSNADLKIAEKNLAASKFKTKGAASGYYPQISASSGYQHIDTFRGKSETGFAGNGSQDTGSFTGVGSAASQFSSNLALTQNIFSGFQDEAKVAQAKANEKATEATWKTARAKVSFELRSAFAGVEYGQNNVKLTKAIAQRRAENLSIVKLRFEGGNENKGSFLLATAGVAQAELDVFDAENLLRSSQSDLGRVLGRSESTPILVKGSQPINPPPAAVDFNDLTLKTPEYEQTVAQLGVAEQELELARALRLPSLDLTSQLSDRNTNSLDGTGRFLIGANVSIPIFTGNKNDYAIKSANASLAAASSTVTSTARLLRVKIEKAWNSFRSATRQVEVSETYVTAAQVRAEIARSRYNNGLLSFEDWDGIENDLILRQKNLLSAKRDRVLAEATWEQAIGEGQLT